jgi:hypothetical protein
MPPKRIKKPGPLPLRVESPQPTPTAESSAAAATVNRVRENILKVKEKQLPGLYQQVISVFR